MYLTIMVALGGAAGTVARYWTGIWAARAWGEVFPWGTLLINVLGSFVIGLFATMTVDGGAIPLRAEARLVFMVGVCGGFTTFSSFSLQTLALASTGQWREAVLYVLASNVLCLVAVAAGWGIALLAGGRWFG